MPLLPATNKQVPENSILDTFDKQTYLGNAFVLAASDITLSGTSETPLVLIENPALANTSFQNQKAIFCNLRRFTSTLQSVQIKLYSNPTVSGTTTATIPANQRVAYTTVSISKCYANGNFTVSANGTLMSNLGCSGNNYVVQDETLMVIIDPGNSILITGTALSANTVINSDVSWFEI
jgi:hypothetical protein